MTDDSITVYYVPRLQSDHCWECEGTSVTAMGKRNRKLTPAEKAEKKGRQRGYMTVFINGKQKRIKRPPTVDGIPVDEFIRRNADPIWLHQNGMHEELYQLELAEEDSQLGPARDFRKAVRHTDELPF